MDKFATNIYNLCTEIQPYTYILVIVALIIIGVMLLVPSDESRQKAKKAIPWVIIGAILIIGAVYLGKWLTGKIVF
ncbi:hypothetical protein [uncultured Merdimonas sp.]|uniref:hypothetical protein n=1 Tax=uncultured Merdimonas sp. TaxID=2023269 RepID=UPI00320A23CE